MTRTRGPLTETETETRRGRTRKGITLETRGRGRRRTEETGVTGGAEAEAEAGRWTRAGNEKGIEIIATETETEIVTGNAIGIGKYLYHNHNLKDI